jgi:hypothetical protein
MELFGYDFDFLLIIYYLFEATNLLIIYSSLFKIV